MIRLYSVIHDNNDMFLFPSVFNIRMSTRDNQDFVFYAGPNPMTKEQKW